MSDADQSKEVSLEAFRSLDLAGILRDVDRSHFWPTHMALGRLSEKLENDGDSSGANAALLLSIACSFLYQPGQGCNSWGPSWRSGDQRSFQADDLEQWHLNVLASFAPEIEDADLQARVSDILWECKQGFQFGRIAVAAYCRSSKPNDPVTAHYYAIKLDRAACLAARLERGKPLHLNVIAKIEDVISEYENKPGFENFVSDLGAILLSHQMGDAVRYASLFERLAREALLSQHWHFSITHWNQAAEWHGRLKDEIEYRRCRQMAGETMIQRGQDPVGRARNGHGYSAGWLMRGIECLRAFKEDPKRIEILHLELLEVQKAHLGELQPIKINPLEVEGYEEQWKRHSDSILNGIQGLSLEDAIMKLAGIMKPMSVPEIRERIFDDLKRGIYHHLGTNILDANGKKVAEIEPLNANAPDDDPSLQKRMFQWAAKWEWACACDWYIEPARMAIVGDHRLSERNLGFLISSNPFIPEGRECLYARGILAGFYGDFILSSHLLVPQLENSIREIFKAHGVITSRIQDGLQRENDLGGMLTHELTVKVFGADTAFHLRGILIEKCGENLRNEMAHGLLPEAGFYRAGCCYIWWLTIRILWIGMRMGLNESASPRS